MMVDTRSTKKSRKVVAGKFSDDEVDYAGTADALAGDGSVASDEDRKPNEEPTSSADDSSEENDDLSDGNSRSADENIDDNDGTVSSDEDDQSDSSPKERTEEDDAENEDSDNDEEDSEDQEEESDSEEVKIKNPNQLYSMNMPSLTGEPCTFDLRNLLAVNAHQMNSNALYGSKASSTKENANIAITIPGMNMELLPNEKYLLEKATDGCSQLIRALWQLPVERSDGGPLVRLPAFDESKIPRSLPPPPPKKESKWEKFAKEKGISLNKEKRSQKVWDEATGSWMFRHGYQKANNDSKEWPIVEIKDNEDPFEDPWERQRETKLARVEKNREQRMRNEERAGTISKGTTSRLLKSAKHRRDAGKIGGMMDRENILPVGVPVDLNRTEGATAKRGKESTVKALLATQISTASLGKFDKMRGGEPERKKSASKALRKRKAEGSATDPKMISSEHERSLKLLKTVVDGGAKKERDIKKGRHATGETAYDYDFDDGLGPSAFRKKKGRAGAGKLKKMTKKRVK